MIPYPEISPLEVSFVTISPFFVCVGIGIVVGFYSTLDRAKALGLDATIMYRMAIWVILCSFFSAHIFAMLLDYPGRLLEKPWELFYIWAPLSSVGGFIGAIAVVFIFSRLYRISHLAYSDALIWGFIPGWVFGRLGCFLVHDHPGIPSTFMLAVQYPNGARHDLGLYELLFTLLILWPLSRFIGKKTSAHGLLTAIMAIFYMSVRFVLDFLRASDGIPGAEPRFGILTQAQWVCMPLLVVSFVFLIRVLQERGQNFSST